MADHATLNRAMQKHLTHVKALQERDRKAAQEAIARHQQLVRPESGTPRGS